MISILMAAGLAAAPAGDPALQGLRDLEGCWSAPGQVRGKPTKNRVRGAWRVVRRSGHILLEGVPDGMPVRDIADSIRATVPAVLDVHHVHAWSLTHERPVVTLHAVIAEGADGNAAVDHDC